MSILPTVNGIEAYKLTITRTMNAPESISYSMRDLAAVAMQAGQPPANSGVYDISLGGAVVARMRSDGPGLSWSGPGEVSESGKSIGIDLQDSAVIHRFSAQQITLQDAFTGARNGITIRAADPAVITTALPGQAGIATAGSQFTFVLDAAVQGQVLDVDIKDDTLLHATQVICARLGAFVDPQRTNYVIDSGARTVTIGALGTGTITFGAGGFPVEVGSSEQTQDTAVYGRVSIKAAGARHGLPATGTITGLGVTHVTKGKPSYAVVGFYSSASVGGVYFWRGDAFYPMSQAMGVNGLSFGDQYIWAATDAGVYFKEHDVSSTEPFARLNYAPGDVDSGKGMCLRCLKVQDVAGIPYALVEYPNGNRHVAVYANVDGGIGMPGWKPVVSGSGITDFAVKGEYCFYVLSADPTHLQIKHLERGSPSPVAVPNGAAIAGLDAVAGLGITTVLVRTAQGSGELYVAGTAGALTQINTDNTLVDGYGAPVMVNALCVNAGGFLECATAKVGSTLLAATSNGMYSCGISDGSGGWQRTDGQSAIGDFTCAFAASDGTNAYAASDSSFYVSTNGSVNWIDVLSEPLDAGPFFYDHYWRAGRGLPPDQDVLDITDPAIPFGYSLRRSKQGIGTYAYELINPGANSQRFRGDELPEVGAAGLTSELAASRILVGQMARFLSLTAQAQKIVEIVSHTTDGDSHLLEVQPGWTAVVAEEPMQTTIGPGRAAQDQVGSWNGTYHVLSHVIEYDRDTTGPRVITTHTRMATRFLDSSNGDPMAQIAAMQNRVAKSIQYRVGKH